MLMRTVAVLPSLCICLVLLVQWEQVLATGAMTQSHPLCQELVRFRDVELPQTWDSLVDQYVLRAGALAQYNSLKDELMKEHSYASSDLQIALLSVKTMTDVLNDLFAIVYVMHPGAKEIALIGGGQAQVLNTAALVQRAKDTNSVNDIRETIEVVQSEDLAAKMGLMAAARLHRVGRITQFFANLAENVKTWNDFSSYRKELSLYVRMVDETIAEHSASVDAMRGDITLLQKHKAEVESILALLCGSPPGSAAVLAGSAVSKSYVKFQDGRILPLEMSRDLGAFISTDKKYLCKPIQLLPSDQSGHLSDKWFRISETGSIDRMPALQITDIESGTSWVSVNGQFTSAKDCVVGAAIMSSGATGQTFGLDFVLCWHQ